MKIAALLLALPLVGLHQTVVGHGKPVTQTRKAEAATMVVGSGAVEVVVRKGSPKLVVSAQKEILSHLRTEFRQGRLTAWVEGSSSTDEPIKIWYTGPNVSSLEGSGATTFDAKGLSGHDSKISLSGASKAKVEGKVDKLEIEASGASQADLRKLQSRDARVQASGASQVRLWATQSIEAEASGASQIRHAMPVKGPIKADTSGASMIGPDR